VAKSNWTHQAGGSFWSQLGSSLGKFNFKNNKGKAAKSLIKGGCSGFNL